MTELDLAYLAGLIDGEGSIMLKLTGNTICRMPFVSITTTTRELVDWLPAMFGGNIQHGRSKNAKWADSYRWSLTGNSAILLYKRVQPYMRCKSKVERIQFIIDHWKPVYKNSSAEGKKYTADVELQYMKMMNQAKNPVYSKVILEVYPQLMNPNVGGV